MTFLATTALPEFWEPTDDLLLLGTWCLRASRRSEWANRRYRVLPSPWNDRKRFYEAARYVDSCYESMLSRLTAYLTTVHGVDLGERYWRVLVGPWLLHHVHQMYDRYVHLLDALELEPSLQTIVLDERVFMTPADAHQQADLADDDLYNWQLISQILSGLGHQFPSRLPLGPADADVSAGRSRRRLLRRALARMADAVGRIQLRMGIAPLAVGVPQGISRPGLASRLGFTAAWIDVAIPSSGRARPGRARFDLAGISSNDHFERILIGALPQNFPARYLEGFAATREAVRRAYPRRPRVVLSSVGWYYYEGFKFLAAETAAEGGRLVAAQHGGGYGLLRYNPHERHEAAVADRFLVWGWADGAGSVHRNAPSPAISRLPARRKRAGGSILFVANENFRYVYRLHSWHLGSQVDEWLDGQRRFLAALPPRHRATVEFRPYPQDFDHGYDIRQVVARQFPEVKVRGDRPLARALRDSRVVIVDSCSTTLLEAVGAGFPTIAFWDAVRWETREDAESYLDELRRVGVLWETPEEAAAQVVRVYDDVTAWWDGRPVRSARRRFAERFALARSDWPAHWARALTEEAALARR